MIAIIDYGAGNIFSVKNALDYLGCENKLTAKKEDIIAADALILPGVGAFPWAMSELNKSGLVETVKEQARLKPFMGIWEETSNVQQIFERIFNICLPELYMKMFRVKVVMGLNSITEAVNVIADASIIEYLNEENRREFESTTRTDSGKAYQYGARTKAHGHRTPDSVAMDQRIKFKEKGGTDDDT